MDNSEKAYAYMVSQIDRALKLLYKDNVLEWGHIRRILEDAIQDSDAIAAGEKEY